jgi:hypothetical protein
LVGAAGVRAAVAMDLHKQLSVIMLLVVVEAEPQLFVKL